MENQNIKLTDDTIKNIQRMAPHLTERQQQIAFGMFLGLMVDKPKGPFKEHKETG